MNRRVIAAVSDMIFASKIRGTAEALNVTVNFARSEDSLFDAAKADVPSLVILDLHAERPDPFSIAARPHERPDPSAIAARLKADEQLRDVPIVAFFSHVETELQRRAKEAGV